MLKRIKNIFKLFVPLSLISFLIYGTIYATVHQSYRMSANDPQIQMAQDVASMLEKNPSLETINSIPKIDPSKSLAPFIIVFDQNGSPLATTANLNGRVPMPPVGIFESINTKGEDRVTWQPTPDIRIAAVITAYHGEKSGYVLAGRSLKEVENREGMLTLEVGLAFGVTLLLTLITLYLFLPPSKK